MASADISARIGVIKPTLKSRSLHDLRELLPEGVELIDEQMGFAYRSLDEFRAAMPAYAEKVAALAARGVDMIHPEGAPPFMLQGRAEETRLIDEWQARHGVPVFTTGSTQVAAMRALGVKRFVGFTPFTGELADAFAAYFTHAGFDVLFMGKPVAEDENVYDLTTPEIAERIIGAFAGVPRGAEALYILGSDWRVIDVMARLEAALQIPVLHPVMVRCWYIRRMLGLDEPVPGHGRLLAQMPALA
jgi:maleate isomerase